MKKSIFSKGDFSTRRAELLKRINIRYPDVKKGAILIFAAFEQGTSKFKQESSFYYLTGVNEPGAVLLISLDGASALYTPNSGSTRLHWVSSAVDANTHKAPDLGFDVIRNLGEPLKGYEFAPFFTQAEYANLLSFVNQLIKEEGTIFTINPQDYSHYFEQRFILNRINEFVPGFLNSTQDICSIIADMRRTKSTKEIEALYKAIDVTILGQEAAINVIANNKNENEVQAAIEYVFTVSGAEIAFASIVGSGKNSTVLHYTSNNHIMNNGDLVVVDIGAEIEHYCGDLTRTYPVSGKFTARQKEIYNIVLETQEYIAGLARPGLWLSNKNEPASSLNHLAREFIKAKGYDKYFLHGLGHFLGLDVHDVGDYSEPLRTGDIITIEPGIYIAEENLGVRIEDNYWIVEDGVICLSEHLPKTIEEIEKLISSKEAI